MRTAAAVAVVSALFVGCSQSHSPVSPSSEPSAIASTGAAIQGGTTGQHARFKGSLEGRLTASTPLDPPFLSIAIEAAGTATHLGRFTVQIPHVVNTTNRSATGTYEFIAANGDTLNATFTGQATPIAPGVLSVTETATITGGTGRFTGATGSFTANRLFTMATGEITGSFEGTISRGNGSIP